MKLSRDFTARGPREVGNDYYALLQMVLGNGEVTWLAPRLWMKVIKGELGSMLL